MATFEKALPFVLKHEGHRFTNDPKDPGGATKFGISLRFLKEASINCDLDHDGDVDEHDVAILDIGTASQLYGHYFWFPGRFGLYRAQAPATKAFDMAVNLGLRRAGRILQHCLVSDFGRPLVVDGITGGRTLAAVNAVDPGRLVESLSKAQEAYYRGLAAERPVLSRFLNGWVARARSRP